MRTPNKIEARVIDFIERLPEIAQQIQQAIEKIEKTEKVSPPIMELEKGGLVKVTKIGECGVGEIINLPDDAQVIPHEIAESIAKSKNLNFVNCRCVEWEGWGKHDTKTKIKKGGLVNLPAIKGASLEKIFYGTKKNTKKP